MDSLKILKYNSQPNAYDKRVTRIKRDVRVIDDKFPDSKTDKGKAYEDFRRKNYEYYQRKHENFPERDIFPLHDENTFLHSSLLTTTTWKE